MLLSGRILVTPGAGLLFLLVVIVGVTVMWIIVNRKWGYTPDREKEMEEQTELSVGKRREEKS